MPTFIRGSSIRQPAHGPNESERDSSWVVAMPAQRQSRINILRAVLACAGTFLPFNIQGRIVATTIDAQSGAPGSFVKVLVLAILLRSGSLPKSQTKLLRSRSAPLTPSPLWARFQLSIGCA